MVDDISDLSFEDAYAELGDIIARMESGELNLADSLDLYERGQQLTSHCEVLLDGAELRIQQLNADGTTSDLG